MLDELEPKRARKLAREQSQNRADVFFSRPAHARVPRTGEALARRLGTLGTLDAPRAQLYPAGAPSGR